MKKQVQNWESLIAERTELHRDTYKPQTIEDAGERNKREYAKKYNSRPEVIEHRREYAREYSKRPEVKAKIAEYEKRPSTKARRKAYNQSEAGKASMARRGKRYVETHRDAVRAKGRRFYNKHKQDPEWMERKRQYDKNWRLKNKARCSENERKRRDKNRTEYNFYQRAYRFRRKLYGMAFAELPITLHEIGTISIHLVNPQQMEKAA